MYQVGLGLLMFGPEPWFEPKQLEMDRMSRFGSRYGPGRTRVVWLSVLARGLAHEKVWNLFKQGQTPYIEEAKCW